MNEQGTRDTLPHGQAFLSSEFLTHLTNVTKATNSVVVVVVVVVVVIVVFAFFRLDYVSPCPIAVVTTKNNTCRFSRLQELGHLCMYVSMFVLFVLGVNQVQYSILSLGWLVGIAKQTDD
jgi:hypothetical protein